MNESLDVVEMIIQIVTNIFVIIGGIIAIWQYLLSVKNTKDALQKDIELRKKEIYQRDKEKIIKAIDLAGYYKDSILPSARKLNDIYKSTGIYDIIQTIQMSSMVNFDIMELRENLSSSQIQKIKELGEKYHVDTALKDEGLAIGLRHGYSDYVNGSDENYTAKQSIVNDDDAMAVEYASLMISTLNSLEYFSMYFVHNVADHSVVYQSLHMTFLEVVRMLYYDISSANKNGESKFYVNTIALFKKWNVAAAQQRDEEVKNMREMVSIGKVLEGHLDFEEENISKGEDNIVDR